MTSAIAGIAVGIALFSSTEPSAPTRIAPNGWYPAARAARATFSARRTESSSVTRRLVVAADDEMLGTA